MAVDREFDVYSLAVGVPWNPCNRAVRWRSGEREMVGQAVWLPGRQPAAASGQGSVKDAKSLKKNKVFSNIFIKDCCCLHVFSRHFETPGHRKLEKITCLYTFLEKPVRQSHSFEGKKLQLR